jgi:hypothetical protein
MGWFEWLYDFVLLLRAKAAELVAPVKARIREIIGGQGGGGSSRVLRLILRFRRSVQAR